MKSILITGAASGIGKAAAELFAAKGWYVGLYDLNDKNLPKIAETLGSNTCWQRLDVTDRASVENALKQFTSQTNGKVDVLFNSAGIAHFGRFMSLSAEEHQQTVAVNVQGVINCAYAAFPWLKETPDARMISMSSASAVYGTPDFASYSATKFAVKALTEALNVEWQPYGIGVSDILPPFVDTPMVQNNPQVKSMDRLGIKLNAEQVAKIAWKAAHSSRIHWPVGLQFKFLYQLSGILPTRVNHALVKFIAGI